MTLEEITRMALALPTCERRELLAVLVAAGTEENQSLKNSLEAKIDDRREESWVALDATSAGAIFGFYLHWAWAAVRHPRGSGNRHA